jgi:hypothetical protein
VQDFIERIEHLSGLPTVRHIFEVLEENRRFDHGREILSDVVIKSPASSLNTLSYSPLRRPLLSSWPKLFSPTTPPRS